MKWKIILLSFMIVFSLGCYSCAWADEEEKEKKLFFLSPNVGWYFPSSGKVQDSFGNSWGGVGVSINTEAFGWKKPALETNGIRLSPYFGYFHGERGENEAHVIPLGVETRWSLKEWDNAKAYLGLGVAGYGVKFKDLDAGIDAGWKGAFGGRILLGADITEWLTISASYNAISDVEGYNFGGFSIGAKIKIYF